jgi:hypothetical protein
MPTDVAPRVAAGAPAVDGALGFDATRHLPTFHDSVQPRIAVPLGWQPYAFPLGFWQGGVYTTAVNLAVVAAGLGGTLLVPVFVPGPMRVDGVSIWSTDATLLRTAEWRLFEDRLNNSGNLSEIAACNGTFSFTPVAASQRSSVAGSIVTIGAGVYWLAIRNTSASNTFGIGSAAAGTLATNTAQTKAIAALGATLDAVTATWVKATAAIAVRLNGRVFGQAAAF